MVKNPPDNAGDARDLGLTPELGRSPGDNNGNPLQCSCLENSMDRGARRATLHEVAESWIWLNTHTHTLLTYLHVRFKKKKDFERSINGFIRKYHGDLLNSDVHVLWYTKIYTIYGPIHTCAFLIYYVLVKLSHMYQKTHTGNVNGSIISNSIINVQEENGYVYCHICICWNPKQQWKVNGLQQYLTRTNFTTCWTKTKASGKWLPSM